MNPHNHSPLFKTSLLCQKTNKGRAALSEKAAITEKLHGFESHMLVRAVHNKPTANSQQPTANSQKSSANNQQPKTNNNNQEKRAQFENREVKIV